MLDMPHWVDWAVKPQHKQTKTLLTCLSYIKCTFLRVSLYFDFYLFIFIQSLTPKFEMNTRNPQIDCLSCGNIPEYA